MSCPYKFILGIPRKGFHSKRFMGLALYDMLGTIAIALAIAFFFRWNAWKVFVALFLLGEVLHYLFGVQTAFLTSLGINTC
jgi:hypothetical protein